MKRRTIVSLAVLAGMLATAVATASTSVKPYVVPVGSEYEVDALFSVGDTVPVLGGSGTYRMVGIPDGLGAHANGNGTSTLFMNHELGFNVQSEPYVGGTKNRGAIVSKWILDSDGDPTAGKRAYDKVYLGDTLIGDAATSRECNSVVRAVLLRLAGRIGARLRSPDLLRERGAGRHVDVRRKGRPGRGGLRQQRCGRGSRTSRARPFRVGELARAAQLRH